MTQQKKDNDVSEMDWFMFRMSVRTQIYKSWVSLSYIFGAFMLGYTFHGLSANQWGYYVILFSLVGLCAGAVGMYRHSKKDLNDFYNFNEVAKRYMTRPLEKSDES